MLRGFVSYLRRDATSIGFRPVLSVGVAGEHSCHRGPPRRPRRADPLASAGPVRRTECVSKHWLHGLITHPEHRRKIPQPLTGFFRQTQNHIIDFPFAVFPIVGDEDDDDNQDGVLDFPFAVFPIMGDDGHDDQDGVLDFPFMGDDDYDQDDFPFVWDDDDADADQDDLPLVWDEDDDLFHFLEDDDDGYHSGITSVPDFLSIVGENAHQVASPSLSFLPAGYRSIQPKHCSDGLVLCLCWKVFPMMHESDYVVCNPATQQYETLPGYGHHGRSSMPLHLAADPASGHFHVFAMLENHHGYIGALDIYSSKDRAWSHKEAHWDHDALPVYPQHTVFLHGMLHLLTMRRTIATLDTQGSSWKKIHLLEKMESMDVEVPSWPFIGKSQGHLHYINYSHDNYYTLSVWILQADNTWIHKHKISTHALFRNKLYTKQDLHVREISLVAMHPERNTIFFAVSDEKKLMSYDMGRRRGKTRLRGLLNCHTDGMVFNPYHPYVPSWRSIPPLHPE
uniref:Uncharacterized protein n=1 Tax=Avena sativa TaxID=4498 RepID=A0ACD5WW83_AVESA